MALQQAEIACSAALELDPANPKALYRRAQVSPASQLLPRLWLLPAGGHTLCLPKHAE